MEQQKSKKKLNIAILSPNKDVYSETFIQAHKNHIDGNIFYYYDGYIPCKLEGYDNLSDIEIEPKLKKIIGNDQNLSRLYYLQKSLWNNKIDVVLAEYGVTASESLLAIKALNLPLITHFHGYDASINDIVKKYRKGYQEVFEYSDSVVVVSKKMQEMIASIGCPSDKIVYAPCGPNENFFKLKPYFQSKQFLAVGRFVHKKAPYYTVLAFKGVVEKYPDAKLKMAADGPYLEICKNIAKFCDIEKNVDFLDVVDQERVMQEMEKSLAFVQHSITAESGDMEGTPVAVMEAGAASLPVIATRHAGIPDVVINDKTGLLVEENDVCGMTKAMILLLDNKELAVEMGRKARERVRGNFSQKNSINELDKAIESAIDRNQNRQWNIEGIEALASNKDAYKLQLLHAQIQEKNTQIQEKNKQIQEKNKQLQEKDTQLQEKNTQIKQRNNQLVHIQNSKPFQIGELFFRSIKKPYKLIIFPINFVRILLKK